MDVTSPLSGMSKVSVHVPNYDAVCSDRFLTEEPKSDSKEKSFYFDYQPNELTMDDIRKTQLRFLIN